MKPLPHWVWLILRIWVGLIFAYAGFSKLTEPIENFRGIIAQYEVIPYAMVPFIAAVLPWVELISGVFLILGYAVRVSALVLGFLSFGFLMVLGSSQILLGSIPMSCGCFGENGIHLTVRQVFGLDILNTAIGFKLFSLKKHDFSLDAVLSH
ncbi:MAG: DoxX family membrane protein [Candidatus Omnitrophica bacterium]|nr:DoxX family membrane protein [Candidatus Omnitrophota bacterium]